MDTESVTAPDQVVDVEFWAIVCADEDLLRAEFDGIVSATAPAPAQRTFGPGWATRWHSDRPAVGAGRQSGLPRPRRLAVGPLPARQRSPPGGRDDRETGRILTHKPTRTGHEFCAARRPAAVVARRVQQRALRAPRPGARAHGRLPRWDA